MSDAYRETAHDVTDLLSRLKDKPQAFDFNHTLRLIESLYKERPRLGTSRKPGDDPIRLSQEPALSFETSELTRFEPGSDGNPHRLWLRLPGLLGPNGALPLHYTEYIKARRRDFGDHTFAHFLDMFQHRMFSLLYRAWANTEPTVSYDRPEEDTFADYVGSLAGLGMTSLRKRDAIADQTKFFYSGRLSCQTRCAEGLEAILADYFDVPVTVEEFVGEWINLPEEDICRLGDENAGGRLGESLVAGVSVWSCQHKFRIHIGPLTAGEYHRFLPIGDRIGRLVPLVRNYVGDELAWDVRLIFNSDDIQPARLDGSSRLGWTSRLADDSGSDYECDLIIDVCELIYEKGKTP